MATRSQRIEEIFQRVEEESERRAEEESLQEAQPEPQPAQDSSRGRRRGGSISVSRFGQPVQAETSTTGTVTPPLSISTDAVRKPGFYGLQPHLHMGSADSLASNRDAQPDDEHDEAELTTQVATIGRQSLSRAVGGALSKKLARSRPQSRDFMPPPTPTGSSVVIGVRVEEARTEAEVHSHGTLARAVTAAIAYSPAAPSLRRQKSVAAEKSQSAWVDKAKDLTKKIRRKSAAALTAIPGL